MTQKPSLQVTPMIVREERQDCFAYGRKLGTNPALVDTRDDQFVFVGRECLKQIEKAGETGYQPPKGGPRLYTRKGV